MKAAPRSSILLEETRQGISPPTNPGQEQQQEQEHRFVLELPHLDLKIDFGDWNDGSDNGNVETTKSYHVYKAPHKRNGNISDSEIVAKLQELFRERQHLRFRKIRCSPDFYFYRTVEQIYQYWRTLPQRRNPPMVNFHLKGFQINGGLGQVTSSS